ncbi:hypothetical protein [Aeromonas rivipollensis]
MSIIISDQTTWPAEVISYLEKNHHLFFGWETPAKDRVSASEFDQAIYEFRRILKPFSLVGYHCTKLTPYEIKDIRLNGMRLQNIESLTNRILRLKSCFDITPEVAHELISINQASDTNRANMLWFCFFEPHCSDPYGIYRFFKFWGGEALYNHHVGREKTGNILMRIGRPCIVKAKVKIEFLKESYYPCRALARVYLSNHGYSINGSIEHEGYSTENIQNNNIYEVIEYPSEHFFNLTKCDEWQGEATL